MERWPRQKRLPSSVTWKVKSRVPSHPQHYVDACVVDGSFLLRVLPPNLPATHGRLAATIIMQATPLSSKRVDIIFDTYEMPSIKMMERERRGTCDRNYKSIYRTTTTYTPCRFQHGTQITIIQNGVAYIPTE